MATNTNKNRTLLQQLKTRSITNKGGSGKQGNMARGGKNEPKKGKTQVGGNKGCSANNEIKKPIGSGKQ